MIKFHTYGDSHAGTFGSWDRVKVPGIDVVINWLGPKLMYSFGRDKEIIVKQEDIRENDFICFCFGEIDCRAHINKYEPSWKENIDNLVEEYFKAITLNVKDLNVKVCVYNAVPQLERSDKRNKWIRDWEEQDPINRAAKGTDKDRAKYTVYMNQRLKELCKTYGYIFFDVYEKYVDEKGYLNPSYSDGNCHISNPIFMIEKLKELTKDELIMDKKIIFRKVERKDLEKVFLLLQQLTEIDYSDRNLGECWNKFISNTSANSIVGLYEDEIVAYGSVVIENKIRGESAGHIEDIVVDKKIRGENVGVRLIEELVKIAKSKDCYRITLSCKEEFIGFYSKNEFAVNNIAMKRFL